MERRDKDAALAELVEAAGGADARRLPPVHLWNPPHCGEIDILIRGDGVWIHDGAPIGRPELVRLFSTILRKDPEGYCLVTPVEKLTLRVEDLPFRAVALRKSDDDLIFTTDVGDEVVAGSAFPIEVSTDSTTGEPSPRLFVRGDLWARISRPVFYELVDMATVEGDRLVVRSGGVGFPLGPEGAGVG